jgi:hypothetical protein
MSPFKKTVSIPLGVVAAIWLCHLVTCRLWEPVPTGRCWEKIPPTPVPALKKAIPSYCSRVVCKKCGEEYGVPRYCDLGGINKEEIQHQHLNPKQKADAIRELRLKWHQTAELGRSLLPSERKRLLQRVHEALEYEIEAYQ